MNKRIYILLILALSIVVSACRPPISVRDNDDKAFVRDDFLMGTIITQRVHGGNAEAAAEEVSLKLQDIENRMTINAPGGEINQLNEEAGRQAVKVGSDTIYVLEKAKEYAALSQGAFDITIGPLVKEWGIFTDSPVIPAKVVIDNKKELVNYRDLQINSEESTAMLAKTGQIVDLGAIAKGFAGDEAIKIYRKHDIKSAFVNLGGNIVVLGSKPDGTPWRIGIQNPRAAAGKYVGIVNVVDKTVVTSGDYERYFEEDNIRYHHILDPDTGYPARSGLISVTIVSDLSIDADALSTAAFVLGLDEGMNLINKLEKVEAIFITEEKKVYTTSGLKDMFTFQDGTGEFEYVEKR